MARQSLARAIVLSGVGLHTGMRTVVRLEPAPAGAGIRFVRADGNCPLEIPATVAYVVATERRTAIGMNGTRIESVEHLLAAAAGLGIDDLLVRVAGPEIPAGDGSAAQLVEALVAGGVVERAAPRTYADVRGPFDLAVGESRYQVAPAQALELHVAIDFAHAAIGRQCGSWTLAANCFVTELARARTFGFLREREQLGRGGLARGAGPDNVVLLDDDGPVGTSLRWPDEYVRHKALDLLGDLALLGMPLRARVTAVCPSHRGNVALARALHDQLEEGSER